MTVRVAFVTALLAPIPVLAQPSPPDFDHLDVDGRVVETTHGLPLTLAVDGSLEFLGETRFAESYGGPVFLVSAAAWTDSSRLVAVHAETLADGSGGLDYSGLAADSVAGRPFTSRVDCFDLREETPEDVEANGFLRFLAAKGYDFDTAIVLKRFFATNPEGTAEVVLSFGARVEACGPEGAVPPGVERAVEEGARRSFRAAPDGPASGPAPRR